MYLLPFRKLKQKYSYWSSRGVGGPPPVIPLGNIHHLLASNRGPGDLERTQQYGKIYGFYQGTQPVLMVTDPQLIKQILVKDFAQFANRQKQTVSFELIVR